MLGRVGKAFSSWLAFVFNGHEAFYKAMPLVPAKQQQRSLAGLLWLLIWYRSVQAKFCHAIVGEGMQTPCSHTFTFAFTYDALGMPGGESITLTQSKGWGPAWGTCMKGAEVRFSLSYAMERLWGNWYSEVCLGFDLSPRHPPGHLIHSQPVPFIYDSRINTFPAER